MTTSEQTGLPIAEASARSGLSIDTLRYYERIGLIDPPVRDGGGRRHYRPEDLDWLAFLVKMRTTGMPIKALREYAGLRRIRTEASTARRKQLLVEHRRDVTERIEALTGCLSALDFKIDNYGRMERLLAAAAPAHPVAGGGRLDEESA